MTIVRKGIALLAVSVLIFQILGCQQRGTQDQPGGTDTTNQQQGTPPPDTLPQ